MNIDKIVKECPRALREWILSTCSAKDIFKIIDWKFSYDNEIKILIELPDCFVLEVNRYFRRLYDYFDSVGVKIEVTDSSYESFWVCNIDNYNDKKEYFYDGYYKRIEAEYKAFEKAFEIREEQLNKEV